MCFAVMTCGPLLNMTTKCSELKMAVVKCCAQLITPIYRHFMFVESANTTVKVESGFNASGQVFCRNLYTDIILFAFAQLCGHA